MKNRIKYEKWIEIWLKSKKSFVKESTYANYSILVINHILPKFGKYFVDEINEAIIQKTIIEWAETGNLNSRSGLSKKTIKDILSIIKLSLKFAIKNDIIEPFIEMDLKIPKVNDIQKLKVFSSNEQKKLIYSINENKTERNIGFLISLYTGIRIGELCALKWIDLDFDERIIKITKTMQRIYIKEFNGRGISKVIITSPKTHASNREIPMSSFLIPYLQSIKSDPDMYVITGSKEFLEPRTYRNYYNRFLEKNGLNHINFHGLRHTFATRCIEVGADYKTVSELLGHASINMTLNLYVHPRMDQKRKCVELLSI